MKEAILKSSFCLVLLGFACPESYGQKDYLPGPGVTVWHLPAKTVVYAPRNTENGGDAEVQIYNADGTLNERIDCAGQNQSRCAQEVADAEDALPPETPPDAGNPDDGNDDSGDGGTVTTKSLSSSQVQKEVRLLLQKVQKKGVYARNQQGKWIFVTNHQLRTSRILNNFRRR
jgi:hypothetical protein